MSESLNILLTGFEPFERDTLNPSWEVARALDGWSLELEGRTARVHAVQLPCVFGASAEALREAMARLQPHLVVCMGLAGGRTEITPERVAINVDDARIPDNAGGQPIDEAIADGGPVAYWSTLPIKAIVRDMRAAGVPASVSNTAGSFVCNHVFYALMHALARDGQGVRGGFVHLPLLPQQAVHRPGLPSMALETQVEGMRQLLRTALTVQADVRETGGKLH
ncbi:pyroglutamyl-peptidase I [Comamonas endophytica]|uniref:Pyrrolidone-carboxylate peptidase n=1 Tax=Comamonas endophytica TaxID=2949090 RepID=A0ABY6GBR4_9BURK|nr:MULTISPECIES: pyroglutamyl-peptidase I [unclassified Acidovorax]MCD2512131.1 pyroglutamyl-peptidase I [Acidovorax sp. D4N7]UYG51904.1 pyroglutamyl-peptidase I [Acidovorax sp. 5MLIR]